MRAFLRQLSAALTTRSALSFAFIHSHEVSDVDSSSSRRTGALALRSDGAHTPTGRVWVFGSSCVEKHQSRLPPSLLSSVITPPFASSFPSKQEYCASFWVPDVAAETAPTRPDSVSCDTPVHRRLHCANHPRETRARFANLAVTPARGEASMTQSADGRSS